MRTQLASLLKAGGDGVPAAATASTCPGSSSQRHRYLHPGRLVLDSLACAHGRARSAAPPVPGFASAALGHAALRIVQLDAATQQPSGRLTGRKRAGLGTSFHAASLGLLSAADRG